MSGFPQTVRRVRWAVPRADSSDSVAVIAHGNPASGGPDVSTSQRELTYGPDEPALLSGDVRMVEEEIDPYVIT